MSTKRSIGRWALIGLMINNMIGSGIFGVPGELVRLLGTMSPWACVLAGLAIAVVVACFIEVGSQFTESGGPYLYVRTAFGRLLGIQVAWFTALAPMAAAGAQANLFVSYLAGFQPLLGTGVGRVGIIICVVGLPLIANLCGVNAGKKLSSVLVVAKLVPLVALIAVGLVVINAAPVSAADPANAMQIAGTTVWLNAVLLAVFAYGGFENALAATGDVRDPRRAVPYALAVSLAACVVINASIQWVAASVLVPGVDDLDRPLASTAVFILGDRGASLISIAAMISTAGAISVTVLAVPRLLAALGAHGDLPAWIGASRGNTPVVATVAVAVIIIALATSGTFRWAIAVTAGSMALFAGAVCAALPRLRTLQPTAATTRIPGGFSFAVAGVMIAVLLLLQLDASEVVPIAITVGVALLNWWLVRQRRTVAE
jgi:APA family basic amino acid/polyamine antiporter